METEILNKILTQVQKIGTDLSEFKEEMHEFKDEMYEFRDEVNEKFDPNGQNENGVKIKVHINGEKRGEIFA